MTATVLRSAEDYRTGETPSQCGPATSDQLKTLQRLSLLVGDGRRYTGPLSREQASQKIMDLIGERDRLMKSSPPAPNGESPNEREEPQMPKEKITETGRVVSINDRGLKLEGWDEWRNYSKFSPIPNEAIPDRGDVVTVTHDGRFISHIAKPGRNGSAPRRDAGNDEFEETMEREPVNRRAASSAPTHKPEHTDRDALIVRQVALKTAVEFWGGSSENVNEEDVLTTAGRFYRWMLATD
jgi:hypothetical protein